MPFFFDFASQVIVAFAHDLEDGWYEARFPNSEFDGAYGRHTSIENIAKRYGWEIRWIGDDRYNPWKEQK